MATKRESNRLDHAGIQRRLKAKKPFEISDGGGLTLAFRDGYTTAVWRLRYRIGGRPRRRGEPGVTGTPRVMVLGKYPALSLADARETARKLCAEVALGHDVAAEKHDRAQQAVAKIEATRNVRTVGQLADEYFETRIKGGPTPWKHPEIVKARIEKDIRPHLGRLPVGAVTPDHIDEMLKAIVQRGAPTMANDVLRWTRRIFNYGMKRPKWKVTGNPASAFDLSDAGGKEKARDRALSRDELAQFFAAMRETPGLAVENFHTLKLLLLLAVRKSELTQARVAEFDLDNAMWALPAERTKTNAALDIPLPPSAVYALRELIRLGEGKEYLLPARKAQDRMLPYINESTLGVALAKVQRQMGIKAEDTARRFTVHDFRRTARTQLGALKVPPHIAELCLNHKIKGVEGTYDRHDYFDERRDALNKLAQLIDECERGSPAGASSPANVVPMRRKVSRGR